jgi:hypothetical protein
MANSLNFSDIVKMQTRGCAKCFSCIYTLPCNINKELAQCLEKDFGTPKYNLDVTRLLRIDTPDAYHVEGKLETKTIKLIMPKSLEKEDINKILKKNLFEVCLAEWLSKTLNMVIIMAEQGK